MEGDAFEILGLPPQFDLPAADINRAYFARSAALHPDIAAGRAEAPREMAELNKAKATVEDPERRADALLKRLGGPTRQEHKGLPPEFLMEIMEVRQEIEAAMAAREPEERERQRRKWEAWADQERRRAIAEVGEMFESLGQPPSPEGLRQIRTRLNAWRYIERLIEQLDPAYDPARGDFSDT